MKLIHKTWISGLLLALIVTFFWLRHQLTTAPLLKNYASLIDTTPAANATTEAPFEVSFWGVSTLLFDDGKTAFLIDGFFSRPSMRQALHIEPNKTVIDQTLNTPIFKRAIPRLAGVIPVHSHFDHAMDAPYIAQRTGATLLGSSSSANLARGQGLTDAQIKTVSAGQIITLGQFQIQFILSKHSPGNFALGEIDQPLAMPAKPTELKMGDCYSLLITHGKHKVLVHASAGYIPDAFKNVRADWVFLGVGGLGKSARSEIEQYWQEVVQNLQPRTVYLIHWDNFFLPLSSPLQPMPYLFDNLDRTLETLQPLASAQRVKLKIPQLGVPIQFPDAR